MFTGLIEATGVVRSSTRSGGGVRFRIGCPFPPGDPATGDSIAVDGACLTVTKRLPGGFETFAAAETVRRTTCAAWRAGRRVNLERALAATARLGGHFVQGHIDGRVALVSTRREGESRILRFALPPELSPFLVEKGSIALDGVSLTVKACGTGRSGGWFEVMLIPHTLSRTSLGDRRRGDELNVETDILARFVQRLLQPEAGPSRRGSRRPEGRVAPAPSGRRNSSHVRAR